MAVPQKDAVDLDEYEQLISELHGEIVAYGALRHDLGGIADSLDRLRSSQMAADHRLQELVEQASKLVGALDPLHREVGEGLHRQQEALREGTSDIAGRIDEAARTLGMSLGEVNGHARAATARTDEIKSAVDTVQAQVGTLASQADIERIAGSIAALSTEIDGARSTQRTIMLLLVVTFIVALVAAIGVFI